MNFQMKKILFLATVVVMVSCGARISTKLANKSTPKLTEGTKVYVLKEEPVPSNSEYIGEVNIGDSGFTKDCGYNKVITEATNIAKNSGANIVKLIQVKKPSPLGSTCYRIKAKMYRNTNEESLAKITSSIQLLNKSRLPENSDYAIIYFYRPKSGMGAMLGYKITDEKDSIIGRLRNGEKFAYKTKKFGEQSFYGQLETKKKVTLNIVKGQEYFIRASVESGVVFGRPVIDIIENQNGIPEYAETR